MRLVFTPHGWGDYTYWLGADRATLKRINRLIDDALQLVGDARLGAAGGDRARARASLQATAVRV